MHTWPRDGIPEGMGYLETTSRVDGAPVRIAVPEDPDGEVEAVSAAFNDPEILRHVGTAGDWRPRTGRRSPSSRCTPT